MVHCGLMPTPVYSIVANSRKIIPLKHPSPEFIHFCRWCCHDWNIFWSLLKSLLCIEPYFMYCLPTVSLWSVAEYGKKLLGVMSGEKAGWSSWTETWFKPLSLMKFYGLVHWLADKCNNLSKGLVFTYELRCWKTFRQNICCHMGGNKKCIQHFLNLKKREHLGDLSVD
jgi:hypothetical protein